VPIHSKLALIAALVTGPPAVAVFSAEPDAIAEYTAEYEVQYKGRHVAQAQFAVEADSAGQFVFSSSTQARGIWRLAAPKPAVERSRFGIETGRIVPASFRYQDGSRKGEDNYSVEFDAPKGEIRINTADGEKSIAFEPGLLDRGSLQVALMHDLDSCELPESYRYVDDSGITEYRYERLEDLSVATPLGTFETVRFSQHREGSSRTTILWLAPEFSYLPVRIEQSRNDEIETVFSIETVAGLQSEPPACSSLG
jgi:hypothetical protein